MFVSGVYEHLLYVKNKDNTNLHILANRNCMFMVSGFFLICLFFFFNNTAVDGKRV